MKKIILIIICLFFIKINAFSQDTFFCIDNDIIIRKKPNSNSSQTGIMNLYDKAIIIEKSDDLWYKINYNKITGYVLCSNGIVLKGKYCIKSIDDFANNISYIFNIKEVSRYIFIYPPYNEHSMVRLDYEITFNNHNFYMCLYYRSNLQIIVNDISKKYNLEIREANNGFGMGDSYKDLINTKRSLEIITNHGSKGRYFFADWGSQFTYDIAAFLFENEFNNNFNGIIFSFNNLGLSNYNPKINNNLIIDSKKNKEKEAVIFQIIYEIMLRLEIL